MSIIKNLGLAGGGNFGIAEVAVLEIMHEYPEQIAIENIAGTSVGSIIAALYAVGYTPSELKVVIFELDFDILIRDNYGAYYNMYNKFGMYDAISLEAEIERLIREKTHICNCTFSQITRNLTIVTTNLNYQCTRFFSKEHSPNMIISRAVRLSISYPLIISPGIFEGDLYGDGGESMNYPIVLFSDLSQSIGITFAAHNENTDGSLKTRTSIYTLSDYIKAVCCTLNRSTYVSQIQPKHLDRSVVISITENIGSMQFNLSLEQKNKLYECGLDAARTQLPKILDQIKN